MAAKGSVPGFWLFAIAGCLGGCASLPPPPLAGAGGYTEDAGISAGPVDACGGMRPAVSTVKHTYTIWDSTGEGFVSAPEAGLPISPGEMLCKVNAKVLESTGKGQANLLVENGRIRYRAVGCSGAFGGAALTKVRFCTYVTSFANASVPDSGCAYPITMNVPGPDWLDCR